MTLLTISQYVSNVAAHQQAGYWSGKIQYKGCSYSYSEFDSTYPVKDVKIVSQHELDKFKGFNPDTTKIL